MTETLSINKNTTKSNPKLNSENENDRINSGSSFLDKMKAREKLFFNEISFSISKQEFQDTWEFIDNVWTQYKAPYHHKKSGVLTGEVTQIFACRFMNHRQKIESMLEKDEEGQIQNQSHKEKPDPDDSILLKSKKRRVTKIRVRNSCNCTMTVCSKNDGSVNVSFKGQHESHSLLDSDRIKKCSAIRNHLEMECSKNYPVNSIRTAMIDFLPEELGIKTLKYKEVHHIKTKVTGSINKPFVGKLDINDDIQDAVNFLNENGYKNRVLQEKAKDNTIKDSNALVFARPLQLKNLAESGSLVLIDATFSTNKHEWKLTTVYFRNSQGLWMPGAHILLSNENAKILSKALNVVREFCPNWKPLYFLIDQSKVEESAIKKSFPGLMKGEQDVRILYCTVHVMRTWMRQLASSKKAYSLMIQALGKKTRIGCLEMVNQAMKACQNEEHKKYIETCYLNNSEQWALWSRQGSCALLQETTTNPLESFHRSIKRKTKKTFGIIGIVRVLDELSREKEESVDRAELENKTKVVKDANRFPYLAKFPFPIQTLISKQIFLAEERIQAGKEIPELKSASCDCEFFRKYLVPCKHIFHHDLQNDYNLLDSEAWISFSNQFGENGFEFYNKIQTIWIEKEEKEERYQSCYDNIMSMTEELRNLYFDVKNSNLNEKDKDLKLKSVENECIKFINAIQKALNIKTK